MTHNSIPGFRLIGLQLAHPTTNQNGQSAIDCGHLWQKFETENIAELLPEKLGDEIYAVYFDYEGDHTQPFSYFIGCKVPETTPVPAGLSSLSIATGNYVKLMAKGQMPNCMSDAWTAIWNSDLNRAYTYDFEIYGEQSKDWSNAQVEIFVAIKP
ncbi:GyrI-like domain-containing protein [Pedobacter sp. KR3-3]|uniref:GyrI-like domain-containing protein n=1 Tax=Pedobacter albus TaxID=3113905 RepID=A0ABU7I310_9SPHI|nr:GyrI-like domain-containing protein [Pedobacter sp. KR3-3]MEE1943823.1 GyrI-like domain-containing protein [Pedobacter sp. KR3-3]